MWWYHQRTSNWKSTMPNFIINTRCQLCFQSLKFKVQTKFWSKTSGMMRSRMFWEVKSYSLSREYRLTSSLSVQRQFVSWMRDWWETHTAAKQVDDLCKSEMSEQAEAENAAVSDSVSGRSARRNHCSDARGRVSKNSWKTHMKESKKCMKNACGRV